jgi:hypothetical protein
MPPRSGTDVCNGSQQTTVAYFSSFVIEMGVHLPKLQPSTRYHLPIKCVLSLSHILISNAQSVFRVVAMGKCLTDFNFLAFHLNILILLAGFAAQALNHVGGPRDSYEQAQQGAAGQPAISVSIS